MRLIKKLPKKNKSWLYSLIALLFLGTTLALYFFKENSDLKEKKIIPLQNPSNNSIEKSLEENKNIEGVEKLNQNTLNPNEKIKVTEKPGKNLSIVSASPDSIPATISKTDSVSVPKEIKTQEPENIVKKKKSFKDKYKEQYQDSTREIFVPKK